MAKEKIRQCWYCEFYLSLGPTWGMCRNDKIADRSGEIAEKKPVTVFGFSLPKTKDCFQNNLISAENSSERS